jgi:hypothetical protein
MIIVLQKPSLGRICFKSAGRISYISGIEIGKFKLVAQTDKCIVVVIKYLHMTKTMQG